MSEYSLPNPDYPTELIDRLKPLMTPKIIKVISMSDYGMDAPEHRAAIQRIIDEDRIPRPFQWEPGEVLALTRWWTPESHKEHENRALSIREAHIARAFSCFCLLAAKEYAAEEAYNSIPGLVESCYATNKELLTEISPMLQWITATAPLNSQPIEHQDHEEIVACCCGELITACMRGILPENFEQIIETIEVSKSIVIMGKFNAYRSNRMRDAQWMFDIIFAGCVARDRWIQLAKTWLKNPPEHWPAESRESVITVWRSISPK